jgi:hypothetical protein
MGERIEKYNDPATFDISIGYMDIGYTMSTTTGLREAREHCVDPMGKITSTRLQGSFACPYSPGRPRSPVNTNSQSNNHEVISACAKEPTDF